jgi:hypothetical protein
MLAAWFPIHPSEKIVKNSHRSIGLFGRSENVMPGLMIMLKHRPKICTGYAIFTDNITNLQRIHH